MTQASYNDIAQWYDQFLQERPVYTEVILVLATWDIHS